MPNEVADRRCSRAPESPAADTRGSIHCTALRRAFADLSAYDAVAIGLTDEEPALLAGISHFPPDRLRKRD